VEAAPRLDGRADDDELGAAFSCDSRDLLAEAPRPSADDFPTHGNAVRACHRCGRFEPVLEAGELSIEMRVQRQLPLEDGGSD
jgi:hypothetical protein